MFNDILDQNVENVTHGPLHHILNLWYSLRVKLHLVTSYFIQTTSVFWDVALLKFSPCVFIWNLSLWDFRFKHHGGSFSAKNDVILGSCHFGCPHSLLECLDSDRSFTLLHSFLPLQTVGGSRWWLKELATQAGVDWVSELLSWACPGLTAKRGHLRHELVHERSLPLRLSEINKYSVIEKVVEWKLEVLGDS